MWHFRRPLLQYHLITGSKDGFDKTLETKQRIALSWKLKILFSTSLLVICTLSLAGGFVWGQSSQKHTSSSRGGYNPRCAIPSTRREWRSLGRSEKMDYIGAVQCLRSQPSRVRNEGVLYDDFPFIHNQVGGYCKLQPSGGEKIEKKKCNYKV